MALPSTPARLVGERRDRLRARRVVAGPAHPKGAGRAFQQRELSTVHLRFGRIVVLEQEAPKLGVEIKVIKCRYSFEHAR